MATQTVDEGIEIQDEPFEEIEPLENHELSTKLVNKYVPFCAAAAL